jgi:hypothetical protein
MTPVEPDDHGLEPSAVRGRQVVVRRASRPLSSPATPLQPRSITCPGASTDGERESGAARRDPAATGTPHPTAAGLPGGPRTPGHSPADVTMPHILIILPLKARHVRWAAYPCARGAASPSAGDKVYQSREKFFGDYNSRRSDGTRCLKPLGPRLRAAVGPHRLGCDMRVRVRRPRCTRIVQLGARGTSRYDTAQRTSCGKQADRAHDRSTATSRAEDAACRVVPLLRPEGLAGLVWLLTARGEPHHLRLAPHRCPPAPSARRLSSRARRCDDPSHRLRGRSDTKAVRKGTTQRRERRRYALRPMMASDMVAKRPCICWSRFCTCDGTVERTRRLGK